MCSGHHKAKPEDPEAMEEFCHQGEEKSCYEAHQPSEDNGEDSFYPCDIAACVCVCVCVFVCEGG